MYAASKPATHASVDQYRVKFLNPTVKSYIRRWGITPLSTLLSLGAYGASFLLPPDKTKPQRPIFMVGCSRSGTTLFIEIFAKHKQLANWSEAAQFLELDYYNAAIDHVKTAQDATQFHERRLRVLFGLYTQLQGKSRFVNKHPENSLRLPFLKQIFPDALFIHVIRDGRAVTRSNYAMARGETYRHHFPFGFFPKPPNWRTYVDEPLELQFAHQWVDIVQHIRQCAKTLPATDYLEVRYEDFCLHTHEVLEQLDKFCGLPGEGRLYEQIPRTYKLQNFKWQDDFTPHQIQQIETIIQELMTELDYKLV